MAYVGKALRERIASQARSRCGYCLTAEEDNLWLACSPCNTYKGDRITARDPLTGEVVSLFDPRHQMWSDHCTWSDNGAWIEGRTPSGRAAVVALMLNRAILVEERRRWHAVGWHPPRA